jgi:flagellar biosynthesis chaperone FliJ
VAAGKVKTQLEKLKEAEEKHKELEEKAKSNIQAIQQKVDESAKGLATKNAEYQKRKQELEVNLNSGHFGIKI